MTHQSEIGLALKNIVGAGRVKSDPDSLLHYGRDTCDMFDAAPSLVVFPSSTEEIRQIVLLANQKSFPLVPSGGRTGLSGGATASNGEVVVSMERLNRIIDCDVANRTIRCQAGVVTGRIHQQAEEMGLYYPVDYAATGSSHIGGNIATNAGGNRVIRYGMTRNWVAGLEVVTGRGEVLQLGRGLMKDNSGYELQQLLIGSEGTLGFITEATMRLTRPPGEVSVMVLGLETIESLLPVLERFQATVTVNAFEFFTRHTLVRVIERHGLQRPFDADAAVYALIEFQSGSGSGREIQSALSAFKTCSEKGWVIDGVVSQSNKQAADLWRLRDDISGTLARWHPYKNDLSVKISRVPDFLKQVSNLVARDYPDFEVLWYGHIGDGNVHLNILKPDGMDLEAFKAHCAQVSEQIFSVVAEFKGSISAEHGVGLLKKSHLGSTRSESEIELMRTIKKSFDPGGLMNPGKVFS
ncbi:MAG TPA: FAD-binding oxidoreductase [Xanthomonadales bacterium]|nr:FAD-binding oxidoreductase [Xanthomonadales bacterium]